MGRPATGNDGGGFRWRVRVYHEDTDGQGAVYHANYLRYLERARTEWLRALGWEQTALRERHGALLVVSSMETAFRGAARFDECLEVGVTMRQLRGASLLLAQDITRMSGEPVVDAMVRIACIDAESRRPCRLPETLRARLRAALV